MTRPPSFPRRRGLTVAVQLALTFAAGMYAPRIRAQQIACPASGPHYASTHFNAVDCEVAGRLVTGTTTILTNTGSLTIPAGGNELFLGAATLNNSGTLTNGHWLTGLSTQLGNDPYGNPLFVFARIDNLPGGVIRNESGATLSMSHGFLFNRAGASIFNAGTIGIGPGSSGSSNPDFRFGILLSNWGAVTNQNGGNLTVSAYSRHYAGSSLTNEAGGTVDIFQDMALDGGAIFKNSGTVNNTTYNGGASGRLRINGTMRNYAGAAFNNANTTTIGGTLTNAGTLNNSGQLFAGGALDNSGTFTNSGLFANYGTFANSGSLTSGPLAYLLYSYQTYTTGGLANHGTLTNTGTMTVVGLANSASLTNAGTLTSGPLLFDPDNNPTSGLINSSSGTLTNSGTLTTQGLLNHGRIENLAGGRMDNNGTFKNYGELTNATGGRLDNAGVLVNDGPRFVNAGTLTNSNYFANRSGRTIANSGTFTNSGSLYNDGAIDNSGTMTVTGPGFVYGAGIITQAAGLLQVDGELQQSAVTIDGGTLAGTGTITAPVTINSGGALQAGAAGAPGTLTINGNLVHNAGSTLKVSVTPSQAGHVFVDGSASLAGTVQVVAGTGTYPSTPYTILSATGGVTGTFSGVTTTSAFLMPSLSYDPNNVFLTITQVATFDSVAMTSNQAAVSKLLGVIQGGGGDADLQSAIGTIAGLSAEEARAAYDRLAGAASTSAAFKMQFSLAGGFVRTIGNRLNGAGSRGLTAMLPVQVASAGSHLNLLSAAPERNGAWVLAYGNHGKTDGDANAAGYRQDGGGVSFGADTPVGEGRAGVAVNIGTQRAKLDGGIGKVTADGVSVAAYARYSAGDFEIDGMVGVGRNSNESSRTVTVGGLSRTARADYDSNQQFGHVEVAMKGWRVEPIVGLGYTRVDSPSYTETGAGGLGLQVDGQARESIRSHVGVRSTFELGRSLKVTPRALWTHEFGDADSALSTARFSGAPAAGTFQTVGVAARRDGALLGLGLSGDWRKNLAFFGDVSLEARQGQWNAAAFAGVRYAW